MVEYPIYWWSWDDDKEDGYPSIIITHWEQEWDEEDPKAPRRESLGECELVRFIIDEVPNKHWQERQKQLERWVSPKSLSLW